MLLFLSMRSCPLSSSATFIKGTKIMLVFPTCAKNYAGTIDKGLVIDKGLRLATPLSKRRSLALHISTDASSLCFFLENVRTK